MFARMRGSLDQLLIAFLSLSGLFFFYLNSKKFFYGDDYALIYYNIIDAPSKILSCFSKAEGLFYRPFTNLIYGLSYSLFGLNPLGYYFINILLYIISLFLLYKIVEILTQKKAAGLLSVVLFFIYFPANSGALSIINNLATALLVFFFMSSFLSFILFKKASSFKNRTFYYSISLILFTLGMLSKEAALMLVLLFLAFELIYYKINFSTVFKYIPHLLIAGIIYFIRFKIGVLSPFDPLTIDYYRYYFGFNIIKHLFYYSSFLIGPFTIVLSGILAINYFTVKKNLRSFDYKILYLGLFWLLINMLPYLFFKTGEQLGWMYLASMGGTFPLASFAFEVFNNLYFNNKAIFYKMLIILAVLLSVLVAVFGAYFIPLKYIRRVIIDNHAKNIFNEIKEFYPAFPPNSKLFLIDETEDKYDLDSIFTSADLKAAFDLFFIDSPPEGVSIINRKQLNEIPKIKNNIILIYRKHKILRYGQGN